MKDKEVEKILIKSISIRVSNDQESVGSAIVEARLRLNEAGREYLDRHYRKKFADELLEARMGGRLELWREILGIDFDKFYPEDKFQDFIKVPSQWINQHISEDKMQVALKQSEQLIEEVRDE